MDRLATLGEVSAGIAHEIRNPLAGIKTSAQVLEESFAPNDFRSQLVSRIVKEIDRSNELLKKFFKFAKPGRPQQDFIRIESIIESVRLLLVSRMKKKSIEFTANFDNSIPDVFVDEGQIEQVIINLMLNAIQANKEDQGLLRITTYLQNDCLKNDLVMIEFQDFGCGIEKEKIQQVFDPFVTTKDEGSGLGLAICQGIVERHHGKMMIESEAGKWTLVRISLPVIESKEFSAG